MARLGDVGLIITGRTPSTGDSKNFASNDICFIKPSDIRDNELTDLFNSEYYISEYALKSNTYCTTWQRFGYMYWDCRESSH